MLRERRIRALLAAALGAAASMTLLPIVGCRGAEPPASRAAEGNPVSGGTAVLGSISDVDSWNECLSRQTFANNLGRRIFLRLAEEQGDTREHPPTYEPLLAESWEVLDGGKTIRFRLRDAVWSDGRPVTSADVAFTWKAQVSPEVGWIGAASKKHILAVEAPDARSAVFRFDQGYADAFADAVEGGILPEHAFGAVPFARWREHDWSSVRIASGPFVLERHERGQEIVLVRNPRYFRAGFPRLDRVVVRVVPDASSLLTQLLAGSIDYVEGVAPREAGRVRSRPGATLIAFDYPMYDYIGWNGARPPFDDPAVRRAMTLAIDRQAIVDDLLYGFGRVSAGPLLSFWWGSDASVRPWPYDPEEARRILARKGLLPGSGGSGLTFELATNAGNRLREAALVKIQEQLARIGVRARPRPTEMQALVERNTSGNFDAYLGGWRVSGKVEIEPMFGSAFFPPAGSNVVRYRSAEVDRLLAELRSAADWRAMKPLLASIQRAIHEDQPYTFLYETERLAACGPRLHGFTIDIPSDPLAGLERCWVGP